MAFSIYLLHKELAAFTNRPGPLFWHWLIPFYNLYWAATTIRAEVAYAKQRAGKPAPRSTIVYVLALPYALASDVNDLVGVPKLS